MTLAYPEAPKTTPPFFPTEASLLLLVPLRRTFCGHFPGLVFMNFVGGTLPETKNLKLEGWKTLAFPFGAKGLFSVPFTVSLIRECSFKQLDNWNLHPKKNTRAKRIPNLMNIILFQMGSWFPSRFRESFRPILFYAISFFLVKKSDFIHQKRKMPGVFRKGYRYFKRVT